LKYPAKNTRRTGHKRDQKTKKAYENRQLVRRIKVADSRVRKLESEVTMLYKHVVLLAHLLCEVQKKANLGVIDPELFRRGNLSGFFQEPSKQ